jgi:osmotically-inducible protein OsmY
MRRLGDEARRRAEYQSNRLKGLTHEMKRADAPTDLDDETIRQKVKSEVIGPAQLQKVEVEVRDGVVTLSGDLEDSQFERVTRDIKKMPGVVAVEHRQPAPASHEDGRA